MAAHFGIKTVTYALAGAGLGVFLSRLLFGPEPGQVPTGLVGGLVGGIAIAVLSACRKNRHTTAVHHLDEHSPSQS